MPGMTQENKDQIKRRKRFNEIFDRTLNNNELDNVIEHYFSFEKSRAEVIYLLSYFQVNNCSGDDYDLAERVEDSIYRLEYGIFWRLYKKGKYLKGRHEWNLLVSKVRKKLSSSIDN